MLLVLGGLLLGVLAGVGVRWVLARLPRGTVAGPGPCEAGVALVWLPVTVAVATGAVSSAWAPLWLGVGVLAVAAGLTDVVDHRLPDALTLPALPAVLALTIPLGGPVLVRAAAGALVLLAAQAVVALAVPGALGGGDVKLAPALGAALAAASWWAVAAGPVLAAAGVLVQALIRRRRAIPYGPPALASTWALVAVAALTAGTAA